MKASLGKVGQLCPSQKKKKDGKKEGRSKQRKVDLNILDFKKEYCANWHENDKFVYFI